MTSSLILLIISTSALPLLSITAVVLRRNLLEGKWKLVFLVLGLALLMFSVISAFHDHGEELGLSDIVTGVVTALLTFLILSRFSHKHKHEKELEGAKGIVISEAFHSLIDGALIGATFLISPVVGSAVALGILVHELPKIIGTLTVLRSLGLSTKKTILYGTLAQIGVPIAALFVYLLGKEINPEQFHTLEIASISSLGAIVLWIIYLEIRFHRKHDHKHSERDDNGTAHSH